MKKFVLAFALCLFAVSLYAGIFSTVVTDNGCGSVTITWETDMESTTEATIQKWNGSGWDTVCNYQGGGAPYCGLQESAVMNHTFVYDGLEVGGRYLFSVASFDEGMGQYMDVDDGSSPKDVTLSIPCPSTGGDKMSDDMFLLLFYK